MNHDTDCRTYCTSHSSECTEGDTITTSSTGGNYIMWPQSVDGSDANNNLFSSCSLTSAGSVCTHLPFHPTSLIHRTNVILQYINKLSPATGATAGGYCFTDGAYFCGNGIIEGNEACDCGTTTDSVSPFPLPRITLREAQSVTVVWYVQAACTLADPCCNLNCTFKSPAQCRYS